MIKSRLINFIPVFATVGFFKHSKNFSLVCSQELKPKPRLEARKLRLWDFFCRAGLILLLVMGRLNCMFEFVAWCRRCRQSVHLMEF